MAIALKIAEGNYNLGRGGVLLSKDQVNLVVSCLKRRGEERREHHESEVSNLGPWLELCQLQLQEYP